MWPSGQEEGATGCPPHSLGVCHKPVGTAVASGSPMGRPAARAAVGPGEAPGEHGGMVRSGESSPNPPPPQQLHTPALPQEPKSTLSHGGEESGETVPADWESRLHPECGAGPGGSPRPPPSPASTFLCSGVLPGTPLSCLHPRARAVAVPPALPWDARPPRSRQEGGRRAARSGQATGTHATKSRSRVLPAPRAGEEGPGPWSPWEAAERSALRVPSPEISLLGLIFIAGCTEPPHLAGATVTAGSHTLPRRLPGMNRARTPACPPPARPSCQPQRFGCLKPSCFAGATVLGIARGKPIPSSHRLAAPNPGSR